MQTLYTVERAIASPAPRNALLSPAHGKPGTPRLMMLLIDAVVLYFAAKLVPGFRIRRFLAAFIGAIVLVLIHIAFVYLG